MTLQRQIIDALDRSGSRKLLGMLMTVYARQQTGLDVKIFHDGDAWVRRVGNRYLAESKTFDWSAPKIAGWKPELGDLLDMYRDWWFYQYKPREGDTIVDIGAGIGDDAIAFSQAVGKTGRVLSVEAHPDTFALLSKNCVYNGLANVRCLHFAMMDRRGTVSIDSRENYKACTVGDPAIKPECYQVPGCSLDELCELQGIASIDFLKMNIEGAERLAIRGMQRMLSKTTHLCIACHDFIAKENEFYRTKALVRDFLRENGFKVSVREDHADPWVRDHVYGTR